MVYKQDRPRLFQSLGIVFSNEASLTRGEYSEPIEIAPVAGSFYLFIY